MPGPTFVAFLDLLRTKGDSNFVGAALVTDMFGVPAEFRCTHPVKPTEIQKQLYGSTLDRYIGVELCGKPLLKSLQNAPALVFVRAELLLPIRDSQSPPVLFVRRAGDVLRIEHKPEDKPSEKKFDSGSNSIASVVLKCDPNFPEDLETSGEVLGELLRNLDPVEPFDRIGRAIDALTKQDSRFQ